MKKVKCTTKNPCRECAKETKLGMALDLFKYVANMDPNDKGVLRHIASQVLKLRGGYNDAQIKKMLK